MGDGMQWEAERPPRYDAITGFDPERRIAVIVLHNVSSGNFDSYRLLMRSLTVLREARHEALERPLH